MSGAGEDADITPVTKETRSGRRTDADRKGDDGGERDAWSVPHLAKR